MKPEEKPSSWFDANKICKDIGSILIEPRNAELNTIADTFKISPWIGASDLASEGDWRWTSNNEVLNYTNWTPGQPDNFVGQDCAAIVNRGLWEDFDCSNKRAFICQTEKGKWSIYKEYF